MKSIILPIQKNPFDRIFNYLKHYEFRKKIPIDTTQIYLYLSKVGIKGVLEISSVKLLPLEELINLANLSESNSGLNLKNYFNKDEGYIASISKRKEFINPIKMAFAPQSYVYLDRYPDLRLQLNMIDITKIE
jgi:predicted transcriptional regulator